MEEEESSTDKSSSLGEGEGVSQTWQQSLIPRKLVSSKHRTIISTPSATHRKISLYGIIVDIDGVSELSRLSWEIGQHIDEALRPNFSLNEGNESPLTDPAARELLKMQDKDQEEPLIGVRERELGRRRSKVLKSRCCNYWLPKTLRWPYMVLLFLMSLGLGFLTLGLMLQSQRNHGLGLDKGSSISPFGWHFTPTLLAVIYTLLVMAMVNEIRRTEPYARLSRPNGAFASNTLFAKTRMLWFDPIEALSKKRNNGVRSWALFWASVVNILGLTVVSPFSAGLLFPTEVIVLRDTTFSRLSTTLASPMQLTTDDSVFFRTISGVLLNTTTSSWISNNHAVLPFWPSNQTNAPGGAIFSGTTQQWKADTTIYQIELNCSTMSLKAVADFTLNETYQSHSNGSIYQQVYNLTSFILESDDGCSFGFAGLRPDEYPTQLLNTGGGWWAAGTNRTFSNNEKSIMLNHTSQCADRNMFFLIAPYVSGQALQAEGHICSSSYYSSSLPVTVSNSESASAVSFDIAEFETTKTPIGADSLDIPTFENVFLTQNWTTKFQAPDTSSNPTISIKPKLGGPLILVAAQNDLNIPNMLSNPNLVDQARQIKQRFMGESMQTLFNQIGTQQAETIPGTTAVTERRIVVSFIIGTLLTTVLLLSALMITLVAWLSRLRNRPLNLTQNPSSTAAIASMIVTEPGTQELFDGLDKSSEEAMREQLEGYVFSLNDGVLYLCGFKQSDRRSRTIAETRKLEASQSDWRPTGFHGWFLAALLLFLLVIGAAIAVLFAKFRHSGIYLPFLVATLNISRTSVQALAPYSVIPTFVAVGLKLWWGSIEDTLKRLQPYVSMAQDPTEYSRGTTLSYINSPPLWTAVKAARYRHWLLAGVAAGAFLTEIFTVSIAALWETQPGTRIHNTTLTRIQELRTVPAIFTVTNPSTNGSSQSIETVNAKGALSAMYANLLTGWLYGATAEGAYNATPPAWTSDEWAFVPVDMTAALSLTTSDSSTDTDDVNSGEDFDNLGVANTVTVETPSLRGRLECNIIDTSNTTSWLSTLSFSNASAWNDSNIPSNLQVGYELKTGIALTEYYNNKTYTYTNDDPFTSLFAADYRMTCCGNETAWNTRGGGEPGEMEVDEFGVGRAGIGYWSPGGDADPEAHTSIIVKWIVGHPFPFQFNDSTSSYHWVWTSPPQLTALNCTPIFERSNASVTVDLASGAVQQYSLLSPPQNATEAWEMQYVQHNVSTNLSSSSDTDGDTTYKVPGTDTYVYNISVSYGYLFRDALLGAANAERTEANATSASSLSENLSDRTFNFRLPSLGLNVDFPSYTSLSLNNQNFTALLDPEILQKTSSDVFGLFFKYFVGTQADSSNGQGMYLNGSWAFQPLNSVVPDDLGELSTYIALNSRSVFTTHLLQNSSQPSNTSPVVNATVSMRVEKLVPSPVVVWLCLGILGWLVIIGITVAVGHRHYLRLLPRDVDTIGSVLGFIYRSPRFLGLIRRDDGSRNRNLKRSLRGREVVRLGTFEVNGKRRFGVEVVATGAGVGKSRGVQSEERRVGNGHEMVEMSDLDEQRGEGLYMND